MINKLDEEVVEPTKKLEGAAIFGIKSFLLASNGLEEVIRLLCH